jgi:hypothetical protein
MKTMRMKMVALAVVVLALAISPVYAAPVSLDLSTGVGTDLGTLTYAGGANPLVGANILIGAVSGVNTPSNAGVTDVISGGILSFTTGNFVSYNAATQTYTFGSGGSFTITGTGPGCLTVGGCGGNTPNTASGPTLVSGTPLSAQYLGGLVNLYITTGTDTKDPKLVQFFGINPADNPGGWDFSGSVHATIATGGGGGAFTATSNHSTDISNTPVPEPASILLIGAGLLGFGLVLRKKQIQSVN